MSNEYIAKNLTLPVNALELIKQAITENSKWRIVRESNSSFGIVLIKGLTDTYMEEDATVSLKQDALRVTFHSDDEDERKPLLDRIRNAFSNVNIQCNFT